MANSTQPTPESPTSNNNDNKMMEQEKKRSPLVVIPYPAKIVIHFRPVGGAPILKQKKFKVGSDKLFLSLTKFLKSQLKLTANDKIYIYCNQAFQPSFDERLGDLYSVWFISIYIIILYHSNPNNHID